MSIRFRGKAFDGLSLLGILHMDKLTVSTSTSHHLLSQTRLFTNTYKDRADKKNRTLHSVNIFYLLLFDAL